MRVTAKVDYALRAMAQLAAESPGQPVSANRLAVQQNIPLKFLHGVLADLKRARLVRSTRGPEGGYELWRPATEISVADVFRAVDGPLVTVRNMALSELEYAGPAETLREVWLAARASLRQVLEKISIADLVTGELPPDATAPADQYHADWRHHP
ncbi:RrF2 family transcriptional regulator [Actinophytocola sp.]|uniref:RrF2 family transcriptional regulator n=1 Tax=Actinophytocola sp. TaxID=1872138 RepID=UPI003D6B8BF5